LTAQVLTEVTGFHAQLDRSWAASGSMLCVGLDPDPARMPAPLDGLPDAIERFCIAIVDATADLVCAFKPQIAYFASQRAEAALEHVCHHIREHQERIQYFKELMRVSGRFLIATYFDYQSIKNRW